jgi:hypothetical protein
MVSRRNFLKKGAIGGVAAGVSVTLADKALGNPLSALPGRDPQSSLDRAAFASQLNSTFLIKAGSQKIELKLVEVADLGSRGSGMSKKEAFALRFRGDNASRLGQGTYGIEHAKLGDFSFLMVPSFSKDKNARYYEVSINRLHG